MRLWYVRKGNATDDKGALAGIEFYDFKGRRLLEAGYLLNIADGLQHQNILIGRDERIVGISSYRPQD